MNIHNKQELTDFIAATHRCLDESAKRIADALDTHEAPRASGPNIINHEVFYSIKMFPAYKNLYGDICRHSKVIRTTKTTEEI